MNNTIALQLKICLLPQMGSFVRVLHHYFQKVRQVVTWAKEHFQIWHLSFAILSPQRLA